MCQNTTKLGYFFALSQGKMTFLWPQIGKKSRLDQTSLSDLVLLILGKAQSCVTKIECFNPISPGDALRRLLQKKVYLSETVNDMTQEYTFSLVRNEN